MTIVITTHEMGFVHRAFELAVFRETAQIGAQGRSKQLFVAPRPGRYWSFQAGVLDGSASQGTEEVLT
jgi:ABC-type polar amino acid transport system ATPase subunit